MLLCIAIVGIPIWLTMIALGFKYLTLPNRRTPIANARASAVAVGVRRSCRAMRDHP
jgi:hypothetical protein